nr:MAG TPA: hypothetical protein [Caudoviricetes sp.]
MKKNIVKTIFKKWEMSEYRYLLVRYEVLWSRTHNVEEEKIIKLMQSEYTHEKIRDVYYDLLVEAGGNKELLLDYSCEVENRMLEIEFGVHNQNEFFEEVFK